MGRDVITIPMVDVVFLSNLILDSGFAQYHYIAE